MLSLITNEMRNDKSRVYYSQIHKTIIEVIEARNSYLFP